MRRERIRFEHLAETFRPAQRRSKPMTQTKPTEGVSRRVFVKRAAYVPPAIMTLMAAPAFAKSGSEKHKFEEKKE